MEVAATICQLSLAAIFTYSAVVKARSPRAVNRMLEQLAGRPLSAVPAGVLIAVELSAGLGLLFAPSSLGPRILVVALAIGFALGGAIGLRSTEPIQCACFGEGAGPLGLRQVLQLPVFVALVLTAGQGTRFWDAPQAMVLFALLLLAMSFDPLRNQAMAWARLRGDRTALEFSIGFQQRRKGSAE